MVTRHEDYLLCIKDGGFFPVFSFFLPSISASSSFNHWEILAAFGWVDGIIPFDTLSANGYPTAFKDASCSQFCALGKAKHLATMDVVGRGSSLASIVNEVSLSFSSWVPSFLFTRFV